MSQWHALAGIPDGNSYQVVYHIPVPASNNRVSVSYQTALIKSGLGGKTILPTGDGTGGTISATELAQIQAGSVYEVVATQATNPGQTLAQLGAILNANYTAYANVSGPLLTALANQLAYFGGLSVS